MNCEHPGPWHLGISEEACENAGGKWYRTPCVTLQECIDDRPNRFELGAPQTGTCQDNMEKLNVAYVSASTSHANFTYDLDKNGCFKFCQNLADYPYQIGMEVEELGGIAETCTCLYNNGQVPSKELLPTYATRSLPKFSLKDSAGKYALGLSPKSKCTADEINVEVQRFNAGNPRQQFQLTNDGRIVTVACPGKVLSAGQDLQCSNGAGLVAVEPYYLSPPSPPFPDKGTLKAAIQSYITEGCATNPNCAIGQTWGWPMDMWNVGGVTDFSQLFESMATFNENIDSWDTSQVSNYWLVC